MARPKRTTAPTDGGGHDAPRPVLATEPEPGGVGAPAPVDPRGILIPEPEPWPAAEPEPVELAAVVVGETLPPVSQGLRVASGTGQVAVAEGACRRYEADAPLAGRPLCPWGRGRTAAGAMVYRCADCGAERPR